MDRRKPSDNEQKILIAEVQECCPICQKPLLDEKNGKIIKKYEMAHIYPLNPIEIEKEILRDVEKINDDVNNLDNFIALCSECHTKYDTLKTRDEYEKLLEIKKECLRKSKAKKMYSAYQIEKEINEVLVKISMLEIDEIISLNYEPQKISDKLKEEKNKFFIKKIKDYTTEYYSSVREMLGTLDEKSTGSFEIIASQIKTFYLKLAKDNTNKEEIFNFLVDWIFKKVGENTPKEASEIIISFFIQNCEVFK